MELDKAIEKLKKKKAPRPDTLHNEMLINLGKVGTTALLKLFNRIRTEGDLLRA